MVREEKDLLVFQISHIPAEGLDFEEDFSPEWLVNIPEYSGGSDTHIKGMIRVSGHLSLEGDNLRVGGKVSADLATFCTRCAEDMIYSLEGLMDLVLLKGPPPELPAEMEINRKDAGTEYYEGDEVDLAPLFQEAVALQVPIQTLCKENCKGLCSRCGTNLNYETCSCEKDEGDPRLAALRKLKIE